MVSPNELTHDSDRDGTANGRGTHAHNAASALEQWRTEYRAFAEACRQHETATIALKISESRLAKARSRCVFLGAEAVVWDQGPLPFGERKPGG